MDQAQALFDVMYRRRSIRVYVEDRPVEEDKIVMLLKAAMAAPSACNLQPWEFIVVTEKDGVDRLKGCIGSGNGRRYNAPAAFVVCANTSYIPWESNGEMDCSAAIENILLAATVLDLGAGCWISRLMWPSTASCSWAIRPRASRRGRSTPRKPSTGKRTIRRESTRPGRRICGFCRGPSAIARP
jgi:hypothetical protein